MDKPLAAESDRDCKCACLVGCLQILITSHSWQRLCDTTQQVTVTCVQHLPCYRASSGVDLDSNTPAGLLLNLSARATQDINAQINGWLAGSGMSSGLALCSVAAWLSS